MLKKLLSRIKNSIVYEKYQWYIYKRQWREKNAHNRTKPRDFMDMDLIDIGKDTYGTISVFIGSRESKLYIGNYCSIGSDVISPPILLKPCFGMSQKLCQKVIL